MNPIRWAEILYQKRAITSTPQTRSQKRLQRLLVTMSILSVFVLMAVQIGRALGVIGFGEVAHGWELPVLLLIGLLPLVSLLPLVLIMHFGLMLRTLATAGGSVARERLGGTWDLLLISDVSTPAIIMGKWMATVRGALKGYLWLFLLRVGILMFSLESTRLRYDFKDGLSVWFEPGLPIASLKWLAAGMLLLLAFTLMNLLFTASIGITTALIHKRPLMNAALGFGIRTVVLMIPAIYGFVWSMFAPMWYSSPTSNYFTQNFDLFYMVGGITRTLFDNGTGSAFSLMSWSDDLPYRLEDLTVMIGAFLVPLVYMGIVAVAMLALACLLAVLERSTPLKILSKGVFNAAR